MPLFSRRRPPQPVHVAGTARGEEVVLNKGPEPGRACGRYYRSSRDSTGINPEQEQPILPDMPNIPPS